MSDQVPQNAAKPKKGRRLLWVVLGIALWIGCWSAALVCWGAGAIPRPPGSGPSTGSVGFRSADYTEPLVCSNCHSTLWSQWTGTMHSYAATDPVYVGLYVLADQETGGKAEAMCAAGACHTPVGHLAGEIPPVDGSRLSPLARKGVFCDFCHTVIAAKGVGNAAYVPDPGPVKRGPYADSFSSYHATAYSRLHTDPKICGMCHQVTHPTYGTRLENTYEEWRKSPYNSRNPRTRRICQDCHMGPKSPAVKGPRPGQAALGGPVRSNVYSHNIVGGNVFLPPLMGDASKVPRATAFLKSAARLTMTTGGGSKIPVAVRVTNVGAGHYIPTGVTELREMWVEVTLTDAAGTVRYSSGVLNPLGEVPQGTRIFHTVFADPSGKPTEHIWFAKKLVSDDRIPPKASRTLKYSVPVSGVRRPARLTARLLYRSMPQHIADATLGQGKAKVPVVEMAKASVVLR